jgi:hypothetical protein
MKIYALARVDGGVEIMHSDIDPSECIAKWSPARRADLTGEITEITQADIPVDRTYRNAWKKTAGGIAVDDVKAAAIDRARAELAKRLAGD